VLDAPVFAFLVAVPLVCDEPAAGEEPPTELASPAAGGTELSLTKAPGFP